MSYEFSSDCCSVGGSSVVSILETLEYLEKSFRENLTALFWMASILFIMIVVWGFQTGDVYSTKGLILMNLFLPSPCQFLDPPLLS